jgi:sorting nexin-8
VLYNRENTLITKALQDFTREEREFSQLVASGWMTLADELQTMPLE